MVGCRDRISPENPENSCKPLIQGLTTQQRSGRLPLQVDTSADVPNGVMDVDDPPTAVPSPTAAPNAPAVAPSDPSPPSPPGPTPASPSQLNDDATSDDKNVALKRTVQIEIAQDKAKVS